MATAGLRNRGNGVEGVESCEARGCMASNSFICGGLPSCSIYGCFEGSSSGGNFGETESVGSLDGVLRVAAGTQRSPSMKICTGAKKC
jgi:hypothetical protein